MLRGKSPEDIERRMYDGAVHHDGLCTPVTVGLLLETTIGERRCGYRLTHMGAALRPSLGAELWVTVRLTKTMQPLSNEKRQNLSL